MIHMSAWWTAAGRLQGRETARSVKIRSTPVLRDGDRMASAPSLRSEET